jgi:hypothetical protein
MMSFDTITAAQPWAAGPPGTGGGSHLASSPCEPSLDELLADPIVRLVMQQDGVTENAIRRLAMRFEASRLRAQQGAAP